MDTKKVVIVLLIIAILLSVGTLFASHEANTRFVTIDRQTVPDVDSGASVGFGIGSPNGLILGVLNGF